MGTKKEEIKQRAQAERAAREQKAKRSRIIFQSSIIGVILAAVISISLVIVVSTNASAARTPANMSSGGVRLEAGSLTPVASKASDEFKIKTQPLSEDAVDVRIYIDYLCPFCNQFEQSYGDFLDKLVVSGDVNVEYHPISILDRLSAGSKYSTRAAGASACVASYSPEQWVAYNKALFANQPAENSEGLTDEQLAGIAKTAGVVNFEPVYNCIIDGEYRSWATANTNAAVEEIPFVGQGLENTPTVVVNGEIFDGSKEEFSAYITKLVAG